QVIDGPVDVKPDEVPIVSGVKALQWRFYRQGWQTAWHDAAHLPDGVEVTLTMENGDTWRWVFTTPGDMPEVVAAAAPEKAADAPATTPDAAPAPSPETRP
ncbi:type II secretion system protein GspJ, partial [Escherichia coli]